MNKELEAAAVLANRIVGYEEHRDTAWVTVYDYAIHRGRLAKAAAVYNTVRDAIACEIERARFEQNIATLLDVRRKLEYVDDVKHLKRVVESWLATAGYGDE
jgi:hypothetical protein